MVWMLRHKYQCSMNQIVFQFYLIFALFRLVVARFLMKPPLYVLEDQTGLELIFPFKSFFHSAVFLLLLNALLDV